MSQKILVIEDDADIAELVQMVLETEEFSVKTVLEASAAIKIAEEYSPDAILLDLTMPDIDGWQIFKQLRSNKRFDKTPIAIFTAKSEEFDTMVGLHVMHADAYITKPFGKYELIDQVKELVGKRS